MTPIFSHICSSVHQQKKGLEYHDLPEATTAAELDEMLQELDGGMEGISSVGIKNITVLRRDRVGPSGGEYAVKVAQGDKNWKDIQKLMARVSERHWKDNLILILLCFHFCQSLDANVVSAPSPPPHFLPFSLEKQQQQTMIRSRKTNKYRTKRLQLNLRPRNGQRQRGPKLMVLELTSWLKKGTSRNRRRGKYWRATHQVQE
jgi:hypothetical protein